MIDAMLKNFQFESIKNIGMIHNIVAHHHELIDGSGYPDGLAGEAIPLLARIFQVVDIYDALLYARPYKEPLQHEQALQILAEEAARGWRDPRIVGAFIELATRHPERLNAEADEHDDLGQNLFRRIAAGLPDGLPA